MSDEAYNNVNARNVRRPKGAERGCEARGKAIPRLRLLRRVILPSVESRSSQ